MNIVALSSGVLSQEGSAPLLNQYILGPIGAERPKICYIPTASHDSPESIVAFYETYPASRFEPSHLTLFDRTVKDLRSFILAQNAICVAGGNTANMLAIWRLHGLDSILREALEQGIVLYGASAGALKRGAQTVNNRRRRRRSDIEFQIAGDFNSLNRGSNVDQPPAIVFRLRQEHVD